MLAESSFLYAVCWLGYQMTKERPCHSGHLTRPLYASTCDAPLKCSTECY